MTYFSEEEEELIKQIKELPKKTLGQEGKKRILAQIKLERAMNPSVVKPVRYRWIAQASSISALACLCIISFLGLYHYQPTKTDAERHHPELRSSIKLPSSIQPQVRAEYSEPKFALPAVEAPAINVPVFEEPPAKQNDSIDEKSLIEARYEEVEQGKVRVFTDGRQKVYTQIGGRSFTLLYATADPITGDIVVHPNPEDTSTYYLYLQVKKGSQVIPHLLLAEGSKIIAEVDNAIELQANAIHFDWSPDGKKAFLMLDRTDQKQVVLGIVEQRNHQFVVLERLNNRPYLLGWKDDSRYILYNEDAFVEMRVDQRTSRKLQVHFPDADSTVTHAIAVGGPEPSAMLQVALPKGATASYQYHLQNEVLTELGHVEAIDPDYRIMLGHLQDEKQLVAEVRDTSLQILVYDPATNLSEIKLQNTFSKQKVQLETPVLSPDASYVAIQGQKSAEQASSFLMVFSLQDGMIVYENPAVEPPLPALSWMDSTAIKLGNEILTIKGD